MSPIRFRRRIGLGPIRLNVSSRGVSPSVRVGPVTGNVRSGRTSINLPGPFSWVSRGRRR